MLLLVALHHLQELLQQQHNAITTASLFLLEVPGVRGRGGGGEVYRNFQLFYLKTVHCTSNTYVTGAPDIDHSGEDDGVRDEGEERHIARHILLQLATDSNLV